MAYVYTHTRMDTNTIFYVGIGRKRNYFRAYQTDKRNNHWRAIVGKTNYAVEIVHDNISWEEACKKEIELIAVIGRADLKAGPLANWTNGGEGASGVLVSDDVKRKISISKRGKKRPPITEAARRNLSLAMKGRCPANFHTLHSGDINQRRIANIIGSFGEKSLAERSNRWKGKNNPRSTEVINLESGIFYDNLNEAWRASGLNISRSFFSMMLLGIRKNKTSYSITHKY